MTAFEATVLKRIKQVVHRIEPGAELVLFGSRSRGESSQDSDFDVLLITDRAVTMKYELEIQEAVYDVELEYEVLIEIFLFAKTAWVSGATPSPLIESVRREGVII